MATEDEIKKSIKDINKKLKELETISNAGDRSDQIKEIQKLIDKAKELNDTIIDPAVKNSNKKLLDDLNKNNDAMTAMLLTNKSIIKSFEDMTKESKNFATSTSEWFNKGQELAKQYNQVAKSIGLSSNNSRVLSVNFNNSVASALKLGLTLDDVQEMYDTFAENTGRMRILSIEETEAISKLAAGTSLHASEATRLAEQMDLMGISAEKTVEYINSTIGASREMGLNSGKVIRTLNENMKTMQQYSFAGGVKGMTEMAKQAVKMRIDVSDVLQMADKFYEPEAAIEAAANLQMLGGDIAEAFGDPFETMYLARNKPEELAKRVGQMTENMVTFNEETGEFDMPAEARMQLQAVSKELGIGMESLTEMTRQASKIKNIKMNVSGNIVDEDMREGIAGMARMKDGKWVVDFSEGGKKITSSIDDLTAEQAKLILDKEAENKDKTERDFLSEIALNTQTFNELMSNTQASREYGFAGTMDVYETTMDGFLKETVEEADRYTVNLFKALNKSIDEGGGMRKVMRDAFGVDDASGENVITESLRNIFPTISNAISDAAKDGKFNINTLSSKINDAKLFVKGAFGSETEDLSIDTGGKTFVTGPAGSFTLDKRDEYYGKDGSFVAGTNLTKGNSTGGMGTGNININGTIDVRGPAGAIASINAGELKKMIINQINQTERNGGATTGKQMVDNGSLNA